MQAGNGERHPKKAAAFIAIDYELKYEFIRKEKSAYPVKYLYDVLAVSRSEHYAHIKWRDDIQPRPSDLFKGQAKAIFDSLDRSYDSRRVSEPLRSLGYNIGRQQARTLMKEPQLQAKYSKRFKLTTNSMHSYPISENILAREFTVTEANTVKGTDITYLWTKEGYSRWYAMTDMSTTSNQLRRAMLLSIPC